MKALVLAAGLGERLRPLTATTPKPILEVGGRPLIHYALMLARAGGITEVAINLHHLGDAIKRVVGDGSALGLRIRYAPEPALLGTGGALYALREFLRDGPFVILNGDSIIDLDLAAMARRHLKRGALATLALTRAENPARYSRIEIDATARLQRMRLRRRDGAFDDYPPDVGAEVALELEAYMYCGATLCDCAVLDRVPAHPPFGLMDAVVAPMVADHMAVYGHVHDGYFRTVDDLSGYRALRREFAATPPRLRYRI